MPVGNPSMPNFAAGVCHEKQGSEQAMVCADAFQHAGPERARPGARHNGRSVESGPILAGPRDGGVRRSREIDTLDVLEGDQTREQRLGLCR